MCPRLTALCDLHIRTSIPSRILIAQTQATLNSSHQEMNESFSSVFAFLRKQQQLIAEMFGEFNVVANSFSFILSMFQGKVSFLHSLIFFVLVLALVYEITGNKYTRRVRPWLYVVCISNFLLEAATVMCQQLWGSDGWVSAVNATVYPSHGLIIAL